MTVGADDSLGVYVGDSDGELSSFTEGGTRSIGDRGSRVGAGGSTGASAD